MFRESRSLACGSGARFPRLIRRVFVAAATALASTIIVCSLGCATYQVGHDTLYRPDIQSVYVPIFESESLRRGLGERLTEAVAKEIELKTPYKVTQGINADSVLLGRVLEDHKFVISENVNDEPRDIESELWIEISWRDRNGNMLLNSRQFPLPTGSMELGQSVHFVPEGGQSLATAQLAGFERLAEQIVAAMELPW